MFHNIIITDQMEYQMILMILHMCVWTFLVYKLVFIVFTRIKKNKVRYSEWNFILWDRDSFTYSWFAFWIKIN